MSGPRLLVATRSEHKLAEIRELAGVPDLELLSLLDIGLRPTPEEEEIECHDTFEANAEAKAEYFWELTGLPTLADDSGLCVDALDGGPGVRTKRFAPRKLATELGRDAANNRYLLERLDGVAPGERGAHYVCALAVAAGDDRIVVRGQVDGRIALEERGSGGFGYDPLFYVPTHGCASAELDPAVKNAISHRAQALKQLLDSFPA